MKLTSSKAKRYFVYGIFGVGYAYIIAWLNQATINLQGFPLVLISIFLGILPFIYARQVFKVR